MLVAVVGLSAGCATETTAPFHVYNSPLLEGRAQVRYPTARHFDPLELGDHVLADEALADTGAAAPRTPSRAQLPADAPGVAPRPAGDAASAPAPGLPALSATKPAPVPASTATGAPAASDTSAQPDARLAHAGNAPAETAPAKAAAFVWDVYRVNGVSFDRGARTDVAALYRACKKAGKVYHSSKPAIGDLVFFHNTDDYNGDTRNNDWYTHVALVESVGDAGQVALLGFHDGQVREQQLNLEQPDAMASRHGQQLNSQLRPRRDQDPPFTQYLSGQLFAGFCSALGDRSEFVVIDNWKPGMALPQAE